jgi:hypothetical protein
MSSSSSETPLQMITRQATPPIPSMMEFRDTIAYTDEIMSCEGKKLTDLLNVLHSQKQKGCQIKWILEIDIQYNLFDIKKIKFNQNKHTFNEFSAYIHNRVSSRHEILSVIPRKH